MKLIPWVAAGTAVVVLGVSGTALVVRANDEDHHRGSMHGDMSMEMSAMVDMMASMGIDAAAMDKMHSAMTEMHGSMEGMEGHAAMHSMMSGMMEMRGGADDHRQHHRDQ
jgi:RecA/RadA recombinase